MSNCTWMFCTTGAGVPDSTGTEMVDSSMPRSGIAEGVSAGVNIATRCERTRSETYGPTA